MCMNFLETSANRGFMGLAPFLATKAVKSMTPEIPKLPEAPKQEPLPTVGQGSSPSPTETAAQDARKRRLQLSRAGFQSTIKTSSRGITGTGADLASAYSGKQKLGQ